MAVVVGPLKQKNRTPCLWTSEGCFQVHLGSGLTIDTGSDMEGFGAPPLAIYKLGGDVEGVVGGGNEVLDVKGA